MIGYKLAIRQKLREKGSCHQKEVQMKPAFLILVPEFHTFKEKNPEICTPSLPSSKLPFGMLHLEDLLKC